MACAKKNPKHDKTKYGMKAKVIRLSDGPEPLISQTVGCIVKTPFEY
jgi:hypothetical protein